MMKNRLIARCCLLFLVMLMGYCFVTNYITSQYSSSDYLQRLAGVSELGTLDETRTALFRKLPIGTSKTEIVAYLEAHSIHEDTFEGGQWMRYQLKNTERKVLVLLSDPSFPGHINIACGQFGYIIHLNLDKQENLEEIVVHNSAVCL
jgi:hypothetical protein